MVFDIYINHSRTPGVQFLHNWKRSGEWKSHFPYFHDMSEVEQNEYVRALEEGAGPQILRNWVEV